jgi:RNA polymerase sigma-70 factor (ECF subfamily)
MPLTDSLRDDILASVPSLRAFAISLSGNGDRADDLVQETLLRALANIDSFQPGSNLPAWLFTILRNLFRSDYRKRRREVEDADGSYAKTLKTQPAQTAHLEFRGIPRRARQASAGPARSPDPGRRLRLLL